MIRKMKPEDLQKVVELWLRVNIAHHRFIKREYWLNQAAAVEEAMKDAEIYVYEENQKIIAFVGLIDQGCPFQGLVGTKKISLASLRYLLLPSIAKSTTKERKESRKKKIWFNGEDNVKIKKIKV